MSELGRCRGTLWIRKHKILQVKDRGYRCKYCGKTQKELRESMEDIERDRRSRTW